MQGVRSIITRQNYSGVDVSFRSECSSNGDGVRTSFALTSGANSERGFATFSLAYLAQHDFDAAGLPLISSAIAPDCTDGLSPTGLPGTYLYFDTRESYPASGCPESSQREALFTKDSMDWAFDCAPLYDAIPATDRYNFLA